ncbi:O-acetyl-ADP-ribose deacetylase [Thermosulfuriphilus sp.]
MIRAKIGGALLIIKQGDITQEDTEALVNAANERLAGGGGVDGAIHRAGGPKIMEECRRIGHCPTGQAVITTGGNLKARWVIHTVGPIYRGGNKGEAQLLASAYHSSLKLASDRGIKTLAFPSLSTGAYGYPLKEASSIALETITSYLKEHPEIKEVRMVLFGDKAYMIYEESLKELAEKDPLIKML